MTVIAVKWRVRKQRALNFWPDKGAEEFHRELMADPAVKACELQTFDTIEEANKWADLPI